MKVLVIDDDKEITEVLEFYLQHLGIDCKTFNNGREGLQAIQNEYSDLILLEVVMPEFTGLDVVQSLKENGLIGARNIVIMSASSNRPMLHQIVRIGVKERLKKPCSLEELTEVVEKHRKN